MKHRKLTHDLELFRVSSIQDILGFRFVSFTLVLEHNESGRELGFCCLNKGFRVLSLDLFRLHFGKTATERLGLVLAMLKNISTWGLDSTWFGIMRRWTTSGVDRGDRSLLLCLLKRFSFLVFGLIPFFRKRKTKKRKTFKISVVFRKDFVLFWILK